MDETVIAGSWQLCDLLPVFPLLTSRDSGFPCTLGAKGNRFRNGLEAPLTMLSNINFNFRAFCPTCKKTMQVLLITKREELNAVLAKNADVRVMHPPSGEEGDHIWNLNDQDKSNLRNQLARGLI